MNSEVMKPSWRNAGIIIILLMLLTATSYQQTIMYLAALWNDLSVGEYGHGYLVLAICGYLIACNRGRLLRVAPCPSYGLLPLVLVSSLAWLVAVLVDVEMLQSVGLLCIVFSVVWVITGHQAMRLLAFPILFMAFAIPIWFPLSPLLQDVTADVVFWVMRVLEVPAFRQENLIVVPAGIFSIEEACSGLRYLLASLTLGSLYAYLNYVSLTARVTVVFVAAVVAVAANILRVLIVVYVGYTTEMQHPWVTDHLMLGWYLFGALVGLMIFLDTRFYRHPAEQSADKQTKSAAAEPCAKGGLHYVIIALFCSAFVLMGPLVLYLKDKQDDVAMPSVTITLPTGQDSWSGPFESSNNWMPVYNGAVSQKMDYRHKENLVSLYVGYYSKQAQGKEVINVKNKISHKKVWRSQYTRAKSRSVLGYSVKEQLLENGLSKDRLVWYWYVVGGNVTTNKYEAKVLQLIAMIRNKPQAYVVAISVDVKDNLEDARETLRQFAIDFEVPLEDIQVSEEVVTKTIML